MHPSIFMYMFGCHATICKHVHLVQMSTQIQNPRTLTTPQTPLNIEYFSNLLEDPEGHTEVKKLQEHLVWKVHEITLLLKECKHMRTLKATSKHITNSLMLLKSHQYASKSTILLMKRKIAPNTNSETQRRFHSTKKKSKGCRLKICKSTRQQMDHTKLKLRNQDITCCGICFKKMTKALRTT